jgi:hypothetical protein
MVIDNNGITLTLTSYPEGRRAQAAVTATPTPDQAAKVLRNAAAELMHRTRPVVYAAYLYHEYRNPPEMPECRTPDVRQPNDPLTILDILRRSESAPESSAATRSQAAALQGLWFHERSRL